jgi:hypothetical protein
LLRIIDEKIIVSGIPVCGIPLADNGIVTHNRAAMAKFCADNWNHSGNAIWKPLLFDQRKRKSIVPEIRYS